MAYTYGALSEFGKPRAYKSGQDLASAVLFYFGSLTRWADMTEQVAVAWNKKGEATRFETRYILDGNGNPKRELQWFDKPTLESLCLHLGITEETFANYLKSPEYSPVCREAVLMIKDWWVKRAGELGNTRGAQFILACAFDYSDDPALKAMKLQESQDKERGQLTLAERVAYLNGFNVNQLTESDNSQDKGQTDSDNTADKGDYVEILHDTYSKDKQEIEAQAACKSPEDTLNIGRGSDTSADVVGGGERVADAASPPGQTDIGVGAPNDPNPRGRQESHKYGLPSHGDISQEKDDSEPDF